METQRLSQIVSVEKGVKTRTQQEITKAYHMAQKPVLFNGFVKTYQPLVDGNETFPPESKLVEVKVSGVLNTIRKNMAELFDITATKDWANCTAKANVVVDGTTLLENVPATYLLFLEKQLVDMATCVKTLPVLDSTEAWNLDAVSNTYKTIATQTVKTKKVQKPLVLLAPTEKHPGQAQIITDDVNVGHWNNIKMSGAIQEQDREALVLRVEKLIKAVKFARETANYTAAPEVNVSEKLLGWVFAK